MRDNRKAGFTSRRLVVGAVVATLIVAGLFGALVRRSSRNVTMTIEGFDETEDRKSWVVVLKLNNRSGDAVVFTGITEATNLYYRFRADDEDRKLPWTPWLVEVGLRQVVVEPKAHRILSALLPHDRRIGGLETDYMVPAHESKLHMIFREQILRKSLSAESKRVTILCNQKIQCPQRFPDGTVEPPRLIEK